MDEYNRALLEQDPIQAQRCIHQALRAVVQRRCALETKAAGCAEWNLLQYAEIILRRIGKEGVPLGLGARRQPESGMNQARKAA